jgi:hypothetical protein
MAKKNAVYEVTLPDGRKYEVSAPVGTSRSELARIARESELPQRTTGFGIPAIDLPLSAINEAVIGGVQGLSRMTSAISDPIVEAALNLVRPGFGTSGRQAAQEQRGRIEQQVSRRTVATPMPSARETGQVLSSFAAGALKAPAALARVAPRVAPVVTRAIQGAVGAQAVPTPGLSTAQNALLGGTANVVLPPALQAVARTRPAQALLSAAGRAAAPVVGALDEAAIGLRRAAGLETAPISIPGIAPTVTQAAEAPISRMALPEVTQQAIPQVEEALSPAAAQRLRNFARIGVEAPTTGMVTREPGVWQYERNTMGQVGVGEPIRDAIVKVNDEINQAATDLIQKVGVADDVEKVGVLAAEALNKKQQEMQRVVGQLYKNAREQYGEKSAGPVQNFISQLDNPDLVDDAAFDTFRESVSNRLRRFGMLGESGLPRRDAVMTVGQAEEMRRFIGGLGNGTDPNIRRIRAQLVEALDDDVVAGFGDDAFKQARMAAKQRFAEFKDTLAGKMGAGEVAPERITKKLMTETTPLSDFRKLKATLLTGEPDQVARGQQAWSSIGAQALDDLFGSARIGENMVSGARLLKNFNKNIARYRELLNREEYVTLNRIVRAARDATVPVDFSNVNTSGTTSALANLFADPAKGGRGGIKTMIAHFAAGIVGGPAANVAVAGAQEVAKTAAERAAVDEAVRRALMTTQPLSVAQAVRASAMPQAPMQPSRGFTFPGILGSISGAAFPAGEEM